MFTYPENFIYLVWVVKVFEYWRPLFKWDPHRITSKFCYILFLCLCFTLFSIFFILRISPIWLQQFKILEHPFKGEPCNVTHPFSDWYQSFFDFWNRLKFDLSMFCGLKVNSERNNKRKKRKRKKKEKQ